MKQDISIFAVANRLVEGQQAECVSGAHEGKRVEMHEGAIVFSGTGNCVSLTPEIMKSQWRILHKIIDFKEALNAHKNGQKVYYMYDLQLKPMPKTATPEEIEWLMERKWVVPEKK